MILVFATKYRRRRGVEAEHIEGSSAFGNNLVGDSVRTLHGHFYLGRSHLLPRANSTPRCIRSLRRSEAGDVETPHQEGQSEINELHVPVGRDVKLT